MMGTIDRVCLDCNTALSDEQPGFYCPTHGQGGTTPLAPCEVRWSIRSRSWDILIVACSRCGCRHFHGGGTGSRPDLSQRVAHCTSGSGSYLLVETAGSIARRQERAT